MDQPECVFKANDPGGPQCRILSQAVSCYCCRLQSRISGGHAANDLHGGQTGLEIFNPGEFFQRPFSAKLLEGKPCHFFCHRKNMGRIRNRFQKGLAHSNILRALSGKDKGQIHFHYQKSSTKKPIIHLCWTCLCCKTVLLYSKTLILSVFLILRGEKKEPVPLCSIPGARPF